MSLKNWTNQTPALGRDQSDHRHTIFAKLLDEERAAALVSREMDGVACGPMSSETSASRDGYLRSGSERGTFEVSYRSDLKLVRDTSLGELFARFGPVLWESGKHKANVTSFVGEMDELLRPRRFSAFSQEMLDNLIATLREKGNSNATINRKMAALGKLLRKAHKMGEIHSLPEFRRQKEKSGRVRFLEPDEEDRLFAEIRSRDENAYRLCIFLVDSGCRLGEALGLIWNDLNEARATFWLTKSGRSRTVPLTLRAQAAVNVPRNGLKGPFSMLTQVQFRAIWNDAKATVGLGADKEVVPHILRHTCASRLVRGGIDIRRVQMWLGHQTLTMTMRYAHLATHDLDTCVKVLERDARAA